jgi:hypothetical protein
MTTDLNIAAAALVTAANAIDPTTVSADMATRLIGQIVPPTQRGETVLAQGAEKEVHSKRSMQQRKGQTTPRQEPEVKAARAKKSATAKKAAPAARRSTGSRIVLKANKEVRAQLTAAAQKLGGTRLVPVGAPFGESYSAFLTGFDAVDTTIDFRAIKGSAKLPGRVSLLVHIKDGQPIFKITTAAK